MASVHIARYSRSSPVTKRSLANAERRPEEARRSNHVIEQPLELEPLAARRVADPNRARPPFAFARHQAKPKYPLPRPIKPRLGSLT